MRSLFTTLLVAGIAASTAQAQEAQCYYAAGKKALDNYVPCSSGSGFASCCVAGDYCLADGACFGEGTKMTYIAGCTDPTFSDSSCVGGSTCKKETQFQGLALCGSSWICCDGQGQTGNNIPGDDYSTDCPCTVGFGTAIANAGTLAAVTSLGTALNTNPIQPSTSTSSAASSSAASSNPTSTSPSTSGSAAATTGSGSGSTAATSTTLSTISASISSGITGVDGSNQGTNGSASSGGLSQGGKVGLGVGLGVGLVLLGLIAAALFFLSRRRNKAPAYVTQADLSTPVWMGETPGSGMPAPRENGAGGAGAAAGAGAAGANGSAAGWKAERNSSSSVPPMTEVATTPPPQYPQSPEHPSSQGTWQPQRLQALN